MKRSGFSRKLKAARKRLGYSQAALGRALDVHSLTISRWERGAVTPHLATMILLALDYLELKKC